MSLSLIVLLPFLLAWLPPLVSRHRALAAWAAAIPAGRCCAWKNRTAATCLQL
jgi:hypothetical protein